MIYADNEFVVSMARTLWLMSFADTCDLDIEWTNPPPNASGCDWDDVAPETPIEAVHAAMYAIGHWESVNHTNFHAMVAKLESVGHWTTTNRIAHCVVMQMLGTGVSLHDEGLEKVGFVDTGVIRVPSLDCGQLDLSDVALRILREEYDCEPVDSDEEN